MRLQVGAVGHAPMIRKVPGNPPTARMCHQSLSIVFGNPRHAAEIGAGTVLLLAANQDSLTC